MADYEPSLPSPPTPVVGVIGGTLVSLELSWNLLPICCGRNDNLMKNN
jgi:hypothetical protein